MTMHHYAKKKHHALHSPGDLTFIYEAAVPAQMSEFQTGVPASITIAQAILESGWGKHHIGKANNYFGVKAQTVYGKVVYGSVATGFVDRTTKEHIKKSNKNIFITAHFRSYKNLAGSFLDHGLFLKYNPRYQKALTTYAKNRDADEFARGLQEGGYATDPHYAELLISIMKRRNLYQYNRKVANTIVGVSKP